MSVTNLTPRPIRNKPHRREARGISNRLNSGTQAKQKEYARQKREALARRLEELHDKAAELEKALQGRQDMHGDVWLFQR